MDSLNKQIACRTCPTGWTTREETESSYAMANRPDAREQGIRLEVVKLPAARLGFVLVPRRQVVEHTT
jgi:hypothetical protein